MDLSVIIPAYNMQGYIAACLRSVTRCPRENIDMECLVVDDGSIDETAAIVKRYIERDQRIRLVSKENEGVSAARNRGIEESSGRYIMFLDADDRLCEDAWEQIEAAVEEEYADFTAFSYISLYENGKLRAQMLPLSDVVSTDGQEAAKLMYADSVFNTCWGKLFKSDIVKENHITFRTDLPVGEDFLFVAEYFGYCETYMMTKAMIVYYLQRSGSAMRSYSMADRLVFTRILYNFSLAETARHNDSELMGYMQVYYLKVLTNLFYEYAKVYRRDRESLMTVYKEALADETVNAILDAVDVCLIHSKRKIYEYRLLKGKDVLKIRRYFGLKALIGRR